MDEAQTVPKHEVRTIDVVMSDNGIIFREDPKFPTWLRNVRRGRRLHSLVEARLKELLSIAAPEHHALTEPLGLAGGRNDLMLFEFSGRKVVFEVFATRSQVSRDLRILDKTRAERKIAVVLDKDVDASVYDQFLRENPEDVYPHIFVGELFVRSPFACVTKLRALVYGDDLSRLKVLFRALVTRSKFSELCRLEGIPILLKPLNTAEVTYERVFYTMVIGRCAKMCREQSRLLNFAKWFCRRELYQYIARRMAIGMNMYLYTDFGDTMAVYADIEVDDWLRFGFNFADPRVILSLNAVAWHIEDKLLKNLKPSQKLPREESMKALLGKSVWHFGDGGNVTVVSPPRNTRRIIVIPPDDCATPASKCALKKSVEVAGIESNTADTLFAIRI